MQWKHPFILFQFRVIKKKLIEVKTVITYDDDNSNNNDKNSKNNDNEFNNYIEIIINVTI